MKRGFVVIPTILMLGGLLSVIALTGSLIVYLLSGSNYGLRLSSQSLSLARTGLQDAMIRLIRNSDFISGGYEVIIGNDRAQIKVAVLASAADFIQKEIVSVGCAVVRFHQLRSVVQIDKITGVLKILSVDEMPVTASSFSC